jgi:hypothetical protein
MESQNHARPTTLQYESNKVVLKQLYTTFFNSVSSSQKGVTTAPAGQVDPRK